MELVPIREEHYEFVRVLRNTSKGFLTEANITPEEQIEYMNKYHKNYYICLLYEKPVGWIGVIDNDIRLCTHPKYLRHGVGTFMLREIVKIFPDAIGRILADNTRSQKTFQSANVPYTVIGGLDENYKTQPIRDS
tara:strand:+ start:45 stop:449 length:405 start_codon:yes stop_codon:yes gene_type:complete